MPQEQLNAMMEAGKGVQDTSDALPKEQLDAMMKANLSPSGSATILGHVTHNFYSPLQNIQSGNMGDNIQHAIGAGKQAFSDISSAGAQNAGPVGQQMMNDAQMHGGGAAQFGNAIQQAQIHAQPTNMAQAQGAAETSLAEIALPTPSIANAPVIKGIAQTATDIVKAGANKVGEMTGLSKYLSERQLSKATGAIQSTADSMTKGERESAILEGRLSPSLTGGGKYLPSDTEKQAGQILSGKVGGNAIKNVPVIQSEIAQRGKEAEQFLGMNGKPISNEEDFQMFQQMKNKAAKYLTPEQMNNYDHTINQFQGELRGMGNMNTGTYYKALKDFEQNVTARLRQGNEALLTDSGSAQLQAAKDVRTAVRNMIGEKNPEFKGQMFDLASLYDALDNTVTKAAKTDTFSRAYPKTAKALKYGVEAIGAGALYEGAKKVGVPLPTL